MKDDILPAGFNGVFYFTNFSEEEFKARWNKKEYTFPPQSTVPLVILDATPAEVQNIRKKFAKELAEREFFKSEKYNALNAKNPMGQSNSFRTAIGYQEGDLKDYIQRCLESLPPSDIKIQTVASETEDKFHKDENGKPITQIVQQGQSLAVGPTV